MGVYLELNLAYARLPSAAFHPMHQAEHVQSGGPLRHRHGALAMSPKLEHVRPPSHRVFISILPIYLPRHPSPTFLSLPLPFITSYLLTSPTGCLCIKLFTCSFLLVAICHSLACTSSCFLSVLVHALGCVVLVRVPHFASSLLSRR
eukprot:6192801-Pleurochrysis_carterae.AAC.1